MSDTSDTRVFKEGYNRLAWDVQEPTYDAVTINPLESKVTQENEVDNEQEDEIDHNVPQISTATEKNHLEFTELDAHISNVHDPKNQLASLIKNAQHNKEALAKRNKRIKESKMQQRSWYGW